MTSDFPVNTVFYVPLLSPSLNLGGLPMRDRLPPTPILQLADGALFSQHSTSFSQHSTSPASRWRNAGKPSNGVMTGVGAAA